MALNVRRKLKVFDFAFSAPPVSVRKAMNVTYLTIYDVTYDVTCLAF